MTKQKTHIPNLSPAWRKNFKQGVKAMRERELLAEASRGKQLIAVLIQSEKSDSSHVRFICENTMAVKATQAQVDAMARIGCEELINPQDLMD